MGFPIGSQVLDGESESLVQQLIQDAVHPRARGLNNQECPACPCLKVYWYVMKNGDAEDFDPKKLGL